MPLTFRKSKKIGPVRVNLGKGGVSLSSTGKRAGVNLSKRGLSGRVSAPGTGLGFRTKKRGCGGAAVLMLVITVLISSAFGALF